MFADEKVWGKVRLFSKEEWPGLSRNQRSSCAEATMDLFHKKVHELEISIQWRPGRSELKVYGDTSENDLDIVQLTSILNESFNEVLNAVMNNRKAP